MHRNQKECFDTHQLIAAGLDKYTIPQEEVIKMDNTVRV